MFHTSLCTKEVGSVVTITPFTLIRTNGYSFDYDFPPIYLTDTSVSVISLLGFKFEFKITGVSGTLHGHMVY